MRGTDPIKSTWEYPNRYYHISIFEYAINYIFVYVIKYIIDLSRHNNVLFYLIYFIFVDNNNS